MKIVNPRRLPSSAERKIYGIPYACCSYRLIHSFEQDVGLLAEMRTFTLIRGLL